MRIVLTGGTGYLGGRIGERLLERGHHVRLLVRDPGRARKSLSPQFEFHACDLASPAGLPEAVAGSDAVMHTAALVRNWVPKPEEFERVNVAGSWALCEAALEARVAVFVYTSSFLALGPSPDGRPVDERALDAPAPAKFFNSYQSTKFRAARLLRAFASRGLNLVTLFPTVLFGPGAETDGNHVTRILRLIQKRKFPGLIGGGAQRWNLAFIDDVVSGHLQALERGARGDAFILGGADVVLRDLAAEASKALSVPVPRRSLSFGFCHALAAVEEWKARVFGVQPQITHGEVDIYRHDWIYSSEKAVRDLHYGMTPLPEALDLTLRWIRETGRR